jgi:hypothetical protein
VLVGLIFTLYMLFSRYLVFEEVLTTGWPYLIFYGAQIGFGFLSWFHFYKPKLGAVLLTIFIALIILVWLILLRSPGLKNQYAPPLTESVILLLESTLTIALVWTSKNDENINKYLKLLLSVGPSILVAYLIIY